MPTLPTILFSSFLSGDDPLRHSWARFREQVNTRARLDATASPNSKGAAGAAVASITSDEAGIWRLLAPNNRELGRSSHLYGTFRGARDHVLKMRGEQGTLSLSIVRGPLAQTFGWFIESHGAPVMTCTRWYSSATASAEAGRAALEAFANAVIGEAALRTTSSGRRTSRIASRAPKNQW